MPRRSPATLSGLLGGLFRLHPSLPKIGPDQQKQHHTGSSDSEEGREEKQKAVCGLLGDLTTCTVGALIIRIGFGVSYTTTIIRNPKIV